MFRYIGIGLVFLSCVAFGFMKSSKSQKRLIYEAAFDDFFRYINTQTKLYKTPLEGIFANYSGETLNQCGFMHDLNHQSKSDGFFRCSFLKIFEIYEKEGIISVGSDGKKLIHEYGSLLESGYNSELNSKLEEYEKKLSSSIEITSPKNQKDIVFYRLCGLCSGIFILLILL